MPAAPSEEPAAVAAESQSLVEKQEAPATTTKTTTAATAKDDDDGVEEDEVGYFNLTKIQLPNFSFRGKEFAPNAVTYLMYLTTPLHISMILMGFMHKDECPVDVRIPRYLFFGGIAGLMTVLLRIVLALYLRSVLKSYQGLDFDPANHPGLSMVRVVMYIFIIFVLIWNVNATHIFFVDPDLVNAESVDFCHPVAYTLAYVLVILFVAVSAILFIVWISAIIAGICNPDFLVRYGYFKSMEDIKFKTAISKKKLAAKKKKKEEEAEAVLNEKIIHYSSSPPTMPRSVQTAAQRLQQMRILKQLDRRINQRFDPRDGPPVMPMEEKSIVRFANEGR